MRIGKPTALLLLILSATHFNIVIAQSDDINILNEPEAADDLRAAMMRIGKSPTDSNALYDAGIASLELGDAIVALDFFTRAERLTPSSGRIKSAMAKAQLALQNPAEALRLFEIAIALGVSQHDIVIDRGLAFDLVGNFSRAQQDYALVSSTDSNELTIRQAISYSLSGDIEYADSLLLPLLQVNDSKAWRARAFLLAARGKDKESYKIAQGFLQRQDALNLRPYLKSMNKLTGAQQAAAVHFGHFPASNQIGKDSKDIRIASQNTQSLAQAVEANRLQPRGAPLGISRNNKINAATKIRVNSQENTQQNIRLSRLIIDDNPKIRISGVSQSKLAELLPADIVNIQETTQSINSVSPDAAAHSAQNAAINNIDQTSSSEKIASLLQEDNNKAAPAKTAINANNSSEAVFEKAAVTASTNKALDLGEFIQSIEVTDETGSADAVNLESIKEEQRIKREEEKKALALRQAKEREEAAARKKRQDAQKVEAEKVEAEKQRKAKQAEAEKNKSRYWVQIATGRNIKALKFDYRRISRSQKDLFTGKSALTSKWGNTNRMVIGPFDNLNAAKKFESAYRKGGGDGFVWRSGNGTIVTPLK